MRLGKYTLLIIFCPFIVLSCSSNVESLIVRDLRIDFTERVVYSFQEEINILYSQTDDGTYKIIIPNNHELPRDELYYGPSLAIKNNWIMSPSETQINDFLKNNNINTTVIDKYIQLIHKLYNSYIDRLKEYEKTNDVSDFLLLLESELFGKTFPDNDPIVEKIVNDSKLVISYINDDSYKSNFKLNNLTRWDSINYQLNMSYTNTIVRSIFESYINHVIQYTRGLLIIKNLVEN